VIAGERYTEATSKPATSKLATKLATDTTKAVKAARVELVQEQLTDRDRTEEFHRQISKYVALHPPDKPHTPRRKKQAVKDAAETFGVSVRTVREAMKRYPEWRHFTAEK
jgi:hypothetical protein